MDFLKIGKTVYFPGCHTRFKFPEIENNYRTILNYFNIDFIEINDLTCCGSIAKDAGYFDESDRLIQKNIDQFQKLRIKRIITNCSSCYLSFKEQGFQVMHITQVLSQKLSKIQTKENTEITYFDPCILSKKCNIVEEPRAILEKAGYKIIELNKNKENSNCCGAGGGLKRNFPELSSTIAKKILSSVKTKQLVTSCTMCYEHLKENSENIEVLELSEILKKNAKHDF